MRHMSWIVAPVFALALVHSLTAQQTARGAQASTDSAASVWGGVYTEAQAKRGSGVYGEACAGCHGGDLEGDGFAPALAGPEFLANWNGTSVGDLLERIRVSMPPGMPETVSAQEKADIVAYLLQHSKFPAGSTELVKEPAALKTVKFEATKPGR